MSQFVFI